VRDKASRSALAVTATVVAGLIATSAAAQESVTFHGQTEQNVKVKLTVASFGNATAFHMGAYEVKCKNKGTLSNRAYTYKDLDTSDPGSFSDKRKSSSKSGKFKFKSQTKTAGTATADGDSWSGTYKVTTRVLKRGSRIDTCKLKTTWDAA
jgi:hypothetical protein